MNKKSKTLPKEKWIKRMIWASMATISMLFFYKFSPLSTYSAFPINLTIIATLISNILIIQAICNFQNFRELKDSAYNWKIYPILMTVVTLQFLFVDITIASNERLSKELKSYGEVTNANVSSFTVDHKPIFKFSANDGKHYKCNNVALKKDFKYSVHDIVYVSYSKRNPKINKIIQSFEDHFNYTSLESRNLVIEDFIKMADLDSTEIHSFLNRIFMAWNFNNETNKWENRPLRSSIQIVNDSNFFYKTLSDIDKDLELSLSEDLDINALPLHNLYKYGDWTIDANQFTKGNLIGYSYDIIKKRD